MSVNGVIEQSEQLIKEEKYDEALALVKPKLRDKNALYIEKILFQCGKILMYAGRETEAWIYFNELCHAKEQRNDAEFFSENGINNIERIAEIYLWVAEFKYYTNPQSSKRYYDVVTKIRSSFKDKAKASLARRYLLEEKYDVTESLIKSIKNSDKDPELLFMLGEIKYKQGKLEEALISLKKLVALNPSNIKQVLYFIISIEIELGNLEEYSKYTNMLSKILDYKRFQEASKILNDIERCITLDEYEVAEEKCKKLIAMDIFVYEAREYLEAIKTFRQAKDKNTRNAITFYRRLMGKKLCPEIARKKMQALERASKKNPDESEIIRSTIIEYVRRGAFSELSKYVKENMSLLSKEEYNKLLTYASANINAKFRENNYRNVLNHIIKSHRSDSVRENSSKFKNDVNIAKLFQQALDQAADGEIIYGEFDYYILCDKVIGVDFETSRSTKYVKVVAFMDKTNIITMYPCEPVEGAIVLKGKTNKKTRKNVYKH